jgi:transcriptional regulator of heat shock response
VELSKQQAQIQFLIQLLHLAEEQDKLLKLLLALLTAVQVEVLLGIAIQLELERKAILVVQQDLETLVELGFLETLVQAAVAQGQQEQMEITHLEMVALEKNMIFQDHLYFMQVAAVVGVIQEHL